MTARALSALMMILLAVACEVHNYGPDWPQPENDCRYDHTAPGVPRGVQSVTGDGSVRLSWEPSPDYDTAGYGVYWNDTAGGYYTRIATTTATSYYVGSLSNGRTYYFAVDAFDRCGNSSDLSYETVFDTPRPSGYGLRVWEVSVYPDEAGIDFSRYRSGNSAMIVPWDDNGADIYLERSGSSLFLSAAAMDTDVLPWGYVQSLDEIDIAPEHGWVPGGSMMVSQSHAYLVWTWDNRFAKILVTRVGSDNVTLDWAYQTAEGNPELAPQVGGDAPAFLVTKPLRGDASYRERS
ncbi:fibronectin type III domain-containing protein [Candidatus Fermentibacteria bacterium]|nr:fibronectin type III domain-containing protein [Candidatus Fermentibacteria bacterium]